MREDYITLPEAARRLHVSVKLLKRAKVSGELDVLDLGGWPKVRWAEVEAWRRRRLADLPMIAAQRQAAGRFARSVRSAR